MEITNYTLKELCNKYNVKLNEFDDEELFVKIMNGNFNHSQNENEVEQNINNPLMLNYIGLYYKTKANYKLMNKYYLLAIDNGSLDAMHNLGNYYKYIQKNDNYKFMKYENPMDLDHSMHDGKFLITTLSNYYKSIEKIDGYALMKKYYLMAIDKGYYYSAHELAHYYQTIKETDGYNYDLMKKYYLLSIEKTNNIISMHNLACYYINIEKNYDMFKKYCLMGVDNGSVKCMNDLGHYYKYIEPQNNELMKKYYLMAVDNGSINYMDDLSLHYKYIQKKMMNWSLDTN